MEYTEVEVRFDSTYDDLRYEIDERIAIIEADGWKCTGTVLKKSSKKLILKFERKSQ